MFSNIIWQVECVIISQLLSNMRKQVNRLSNFGFTATYIGKKDCNIDDVTRGKFWLEQMSGEGSFAIPNFLQDTNSVIDEAYTVYRWYCKNYITYYVILSVWHADIFSCVQFIYFHISCSWRGAIFITNFAPPLFIFLSIDSLNSTPFNMNKIHHISLHYITHMFIYKHIYMQKWRVSNSEYFIVFYRGEGKNNDEAFRDYFSKIGQLRSHSLNVSILSLTATASPTNRKRLMKSLAFRENNVVIMGQSWQTQHQDKC